jgi:hypothetical protein
MNGCGLSGGESQGEIANRKRKSIVGFSIGKKLGDFGGIYPKLFSVGLFSNLYCLSEIRGVVVGQFELLGLNG